MEQREYLVPEYEANVREAYDEQETTRNKSNSIETRYIINVSYIKPGRPLRLPESIPKIKSRAYIN